MAVFLSGFAFEKSFFLTNPSEGISFGCQMLPIDNPSKVKPVKPGLYLFPVPLSDNSIELPWLGSEYREILKSGKLIFAENERTARRFISSLKLGIIIDDLRIEKLNKDTGILEVNNYAKLIKEYGHALMMSESGCPAVADPGSVLVDVCHKLGIDVHPLIGPSSILLALMGSGLSGQSFAFHGYLPVDKNECGRKIRQLEIESSREGRTQIFIETPYRNGSIWNLLIENLSPGTKLCMAIDLTGPKQEIKQSTVAKWRESAEIKWEKIPAIFLFMAS